MRLGLLGLMLILLASAPCALCLVEIDPSVEVGTISGGYVKFSANATAADVVLDAAGATFTGLNMTGIIASLSLNPFAGVNATLVDTQPNFVLMNVSATGAGLNVTAASGGRTISNVLGAASWAGAVSTVVTPVAGVSLVTLLWSTGGNSLWVFIVLGVVALFVLMRRGR